MAVPALTAARIEIKSALEALTWLKVAFEFVQPGSAGYPYAFTELQSSDQLGQAWQFTEHAVNVFVLYGGAVARDVSELIDKSMSGDPAVGTALRADPTLNGSVLASMVDGPARAIYQGAAGYEGWGFVWEMKLLMDTATA